MEHAGLRDMGIRQRFERLDDEWQQRLTGLYFWDDFFAEGDPRQSCPGDLLGRLRAVFGPLPQSQDGVVVRSLAQDEVIAVRYTAQGAVVFGRVPGKPSTGSTDAIQAGLDAMDEEVRRLDEADVSRSDPRFVTLFEKMRGGRLQLADERAGPAVAEAVRGLVDALLQCEPVEWRGVLALRSYKRKVERPTGRVLAGWQNGRPVFEFVLESQ